MTAGLMLATERFILRELTVEDVSERYLGWLADRETSRFITAAASIQELEDLRRYVREHTGRDDVLFLGIFDRSTGTHIGNIKYEPVCVGRGYATMGILIGDSAYRGKGVAPEVLKASARWLKDHRNIRQVLLGVSKDNDAAIRAYEKVGFVIADTPHLQKSAPDVLSMVWAL